jgi:hypothetical protein
MYIGTYVEINKSKGITSELFKQSYEPIFCIKQIKEIEKRLDLTDKKNISNYFSYIAFAEYNFLKDENYHIEKVVRQLIEREPNKPEAYLRYWQLLINKKSFELSKLISNKFWKRGNNINFDNSIYQYNILIILVYI